MGIDGFSTTVFCYGQTGSGKTHTLTGPPYLVSITVQYLTKKVATSILGWETSNNHQLYLDTNQLAQP